ncbi:MAG TPA: TMEM175 family protein [Candidatus Acidoferrales bacterium]
MSASNAKTNEFDGVRMEVKDPTPERLAAFSDGVIAVIITIMVLELKPPHDASFASLRELWPTFLSYVISYLFVGVVWVNHHHLLRYVERVCPLVIWANLLFLFFVSLIPFLTAYLAENRLNSFTTALYSFECVLINLSFHYLQGTVVREFGDDPRLQAMARGLKRRNRLALLAYALAVPAAYLQPYISFALIFGVTLLYLVPDAAETFAKK